MSDGMEIVGDLVGAMGGKLVMLAGGCFEHGRADVLSRAGSPWKCPRCLEAEMKASTEAMVISERAAWLLKTAAIPAKYLGARFTAATDEQRAVLRTAQQFRDFILREPTWAALIMVGQTGTGKTLMACQLAQSLIDKAAVSVRYITAKGMISEIQASYGREGKSEEGEIMRFAQYQVLILDEIDALPAKENSSLLLTEIINRRYNENKPVVAISNQPFDNLGKFVGERVHSRLHENSFSCAFGWDDFRRTVARTTVDA